MPAKFVDVQMMLHDPIPSIDPTDLLANRQPPVELPQVSVVLDPWFIIRYDSLPLWSGLPQPYQIRQGQIGDCYLISEIQGMAQGNPAKLMDSVVDYHDGTYGVKFYSGQPGGTIIRVDGDFGGQEAIPTDAKWGVVIEKAYAVYRSDANPDTYAGLDFGNSGQVAWDMLWSTDGVVTGTDPTIFVAAIQAALANHDSVTVSTGTINDNAPLIADHAYSIISVSFTPGIGASVQMRNPWGFDGVGNDGNTSDGIVTLTFNMYEANFWSTSLAY